MSKQKDNKRIGKSLDKGKRTKPFGKDNRGKKSKETLQNKPSKPSNSSNGIRLNKYIANSGICSRREADMYIQVGSVSVNGSVVSEMGFKVKPNDEVKFDGRKISPEAKKYVLLNKPKGFATTTSDNKGNTVMDLVANASSIPLHPIGRLGRNATGLLLFTNDDDFAKKIKMYSNHGVSKRYHHNIIGINSRLDSIQAEVLNVKFKYLNDYNNARNQMAENYNKAFKSVEQLQIPELNKNSTHVYHQYTLKVLNGKRDDLMKYLEQNEIETRVYYPIPVHKQKAFSNYSNISLINTDELATSCLSLPIHSEIENSSQKYIIDNVLNFFK